MSSPTETPASDAMDVEAAPTSADSIPTLATAHFVAGTPDASHIPLLASEPSATPLPEPTTARSMEGQTQATWDSRPREDVELLSEPDSPSKRNTRGKKLATSSSKAELTVADDEASLFRENNMSIPKERDAVALQRQVAHQNNFELLKKYVALAATVSSLGERFHTLNDDVTKRIGDMQLASNVASPALPLSLASDMAALETEVNRLGRLGAETRVESSRTSTSLDTTVKRVTELTVFVNSSLVSVPKQLSDLKANNEQLTARVRALEAAMSTATAQTANNALDGTAPMGNMGASSHCFMRVSKKLVGSPVFMGGASIPQIAASIPQVAAPIPNAAQPTQVSVPQAAQTFLHTQTSTSTPVNAPTTISLTQSGPTTMVTIPSKRARTDDTHRISGSLPSVRAPSDEFGAFYDVYAYPVTVTEPNEPIDVAAELFRACGIDWSFLVSALWARHIAKDVVSIRINNRDAMATLVQRMSANAPAGWENLRICTPSSLDKQAVSGSGSGSGSGKKGQNHGQSSGRRR
ncbi:hypothetical protein MKEN_00161800 [Mycena kentingensis (nom. inval.)]|nr:hypothetical protein MKEN_00161800 [Mycena kentingensis (nom. inval.)]